MLRHTLLLTFRNFKRFKGAFFINLIGLSTGLACTLLIYLWVNDELQVNKFHEKDAQLFQVMEHQQYAERIMTTFSTPGLLAETLAEEIPEIEYAATTTWINDFTLSKEDKSVKAKGYYVGKDYFNIFSYKLLEGNTDQVLQDKNSIVISKSLAKSLFGTTQSAIGQQLEFQHAETFLISGVFEDTPNNSTTQFDFVLSFEKYKDDNEWVTQWGNNGPRTYVILQKESNVEQLNEKIASFIQPRNPETNVTLFLKKYSESYLFGRYENGQPAGGRIEYVRLFSIIAIFILAIASINFMNLSTAKASRRVKEVGVKKALGIKKKTLVVQYLGESVAMSFLSLLVAVLLVYISLPIFNEITDKQITLLLEGKFVAIYIGIALTTGILSGSYPALYLSGFSPVKILKGQIRGSLGELWARRGLVIFQFTLSIILIISVLVIYKQIEFAQSKNLGYEKDNIIYFGIDGEVEKSLDTFLNEMEKLPGVVQASSVAHDLVGRQNNTSGLNWEGKDPEANILFEHVRINYDFFETMNFEFKEGRGFSKDFGADTSKIVFNETGIKVMGMKTEEAVGKVIKLWGEYDMEIVGVVKDFHFQSLHEQIKPLFFRLKPTQTLNVMARIKAGTEQETLKSVANFYQTFNPGFTFDYKFLDEEFQSQYAAEQRVATLSRYFAGFAILISCLGLFGLASFTAERRKREIGIRKVLGSGTWNIIYILSTDFTRMVFTAIVVALPLSFLIVSNWLERFAFRIELKVWFFLIAGFLALLVAWFTVGLQAFKASQMNPVKSLKEND